MTDFEKMRKQSLERLKLLRPIDDIFFRCLFKDNIPLTEMVLKIILEKEDIKVISAKTQFDLANLYGKSAMLDAVAVDSNGKTYNIEVQKQREGAAPKRARYNSSLLDIHGLKSGGEYSDLPETYIIFLTEKDVIGDNLPIYHIDRCILETNKLFGDESHIIYVNGENKSDTELGRLMQDFTSADYESMHYEMLAKEVNFLKNNERSASSMCDIMEKALQEAREEARKEAKEEARRETEEMAYRVYKAEKAKETAEKAKETAEKAKETAEKATRESKRLTIKRLLDKNKMSYEEIAEVVSATLAEVEEIARTA
ncbi:MAG: Rpn family recombination-promoting nuclease/putative transposase [Clostridiales bacterium]|nr:Rpn family recombination-promoting nuclease/putative transposase [Clostridiales bacterium]